MTSGMRYVSLNSGVRMPMVGLGTWQSKAGEVKNAVTVAIETGYRHIDCANVYRNEAEVGAAIKEKMDDRTINRGDLFVVSKLWNTCHLPSLVKPALQETLALMGLDYLDLYLIHWPTSYQPSKERIPTDEHGRTLYANISTIDTWRALENCVDEGLVRSIGVSNFNSGQVQDLLDNSRIKPAIVQVEIHPYFPNTRLVKYCQDRGVVVTGYSPLGAPGRPVHRGGTGQNELLEDPKLKVIAEKYNKTPAQVALRWLHQRNIVVIPKSVTPSRIEENLHIFDFELSPEDTDIINSFDRGPESRLIAIWETVDGVTMYRDRDAPDFPFHRDF